MTNYAKFRHVLVDSADNSMFARFNIYADERGIAIELLNVDGEVVAETWIELYNGEVKVRVYADEDYGDDSTYSVTLNQTEDCVIYEEHV